MAKQKETFAYGSLRQRIKVEWKVYLLAFLFILIADSIGQIQIPIGTGMFILFPIFFCDHSRSVQRAAGSEDH